MEELERALKNSIEGQVRFDAATKRAYSVDASIYEIEPLGVVTPKNQADLIKIIEIANARGIPLIPRGAATGITGGCIGFGLVVDLSKYFRSILEINYAENFVICQPGVIQDELNAQLSAKGFRLGPDTSTGNRATIGGMLANNAAGARSLRYGKMSDHVIEATIALSDGQLLTLGEIAENEWHEKAGEQSREGAIYRCLHKLKEEYKEEILSRFPKIPRRVSGYNLDELIKPGSLNPAKLIAGSEGTLGIVTQVKLKICPKPQTTALCVIHCHELLPAMRHLPAMLEHHLLSLEMVDEKIIAAGRSHPALREKLSWLEGSPQAIYIAEFEAQDQSALKEKLKTFSQHMQSLKLGYAYVELLDEPTMNAVWELRKAGLGLLLSKRTYSRAIAFIEDVSVAPEEMYNFMTKFVNILKSYGKNAGIYGHVGAGCIHIRPYVDLSSPAEQKTMEKMMLSVAELLLAHGGALSGEHGDGYIRSWLNKKMFGPKLYEAFCRLKAAFDPRNLLNPGKIVHPLPLLHDLRSQAAKAPLAINTFLDFSPEGGLELSADLCNGNGMCRKSEGVMCPSFQVTHDEYDSTRARAQALRAIINGRWDKEALTGSALHEVMDLCIQCKGCKTECPSKVDMAKMKSEVLYHYQEKHGYRLRTRIFGHIGRINHWLSPISRLANFAASSSLAKPILRWLGIAPERTFPKLANRRFSTWANNQPEKSPSSNAKEVVLFSDTFTEFNHPEIGQAAYKVLNALGYRVIVPEWTCCGRSLYSKGMLKQAKEYALTVVKQLAPYAEKGTPIIGLEPSCLFMLKEDLKGLVKDHAQLQKIDAATHLFDAFVHSHLTAGKLPLPLVESPVEVLFHGHCHHKAHGGIEASLALLQSLPGCQVEEIKAGCCGMAGAFGFEREHYKFSMQIGALKLFPSILSAQENAVVIANGTSCRQQITDGTGRRSIHLAEFIARRLLDAKSCPATSEFSI